MLAPLLVLVCRVHLAGCVWVLSFASTLLLLASMLMERREEDGYWGIVSFFISQGGGDQSCSVETGLGYKRVWNSPSLLPFFGVV